MEDSRGGAITGIDGAAGGDGEVEGTCLTSSVSTGDLLACSAFFFCSSSLSSLPGLVGDAGNFHEFNCTFWRAFSLIFSFSDIEDGIAGNDCEPATIPEGETGSGGDTGESDVARPLSFKAVASSRGGGSGLERARDRSCEACDSITSAVGVGLADF